jgi:hypothetical protein
MMPLFRAASHVLLVAVGFCLSGCAGEPSPKRRVEYPFQHPAAEEANKIFHTLHVYSDADYWRLARRDRYVWDVCWFEAEVMNGGVDQYLWNSAGDHANECLEALRAIGAKDSCALLKSACDLFPDGHPSSDRDARQKQLHDITRRDRHIDDRLHGEIEVDLYQHMLDYYRKADPSEK